MVKPVDPTQGAFDFGENPEKPQRGKAGPSPFDEILTREEKAREKAKNKAIENEDFKDKRQPKSDLIRQTEIARMKEILDKPKGGSGGVGSGSMTDPMERKAKPYNRAKGGIVKSASKRADGCAIRGKTRA
jgi:hypothetical protein